MRNQIGSLLLILTMISVQPPTSASEDENGPGKAYPDGHGGEVFFPIGAASFADEVVSFSPGDPDGGDAFSDPYAILGTPDYESDEEDSFVTLGCGGQLVVQLTDNELIDVAGPDLYVFEIGPDVEPTAMAVSEDGEDWVRVGVISGGKAEVDIAPYVSADDSFRFIKLVDLRQACNTRTPGADIDAIGAMGSAAKIALDGSVLFDSGEHRLKDGGREELSRVIAQLENTEGSAVEVAGHTDSVGSAEDNLVLSRNRAQTVARYLMENAAFPEGAVTTRALGESQPLASNDTAEGRARNRRVELTVRTTPEAGEQSEPQVEILGIWHSEDAGIIELERRGDQVNGQYRMSEGTLTGEFVDEDQFEGFWIKDRSRTACDSEKQGSEHWGGIRLEFDSPELDTFTGYWRYCNEDEDRGSWNTARRLL
ncbi:OmpA family protein [Wenzhouxiangella sp. EGI_FJ10409]|uniref:OmpA family protein n=1 Tax=Wenzhouxiangella sp. EGI_FJ10409 TaxID=3243767 RepID=UPI0035E07D6E